MPRDLVPAEALLKDVFGFDAFRPGQGEIVEAVARGRNVLAIMPTGGGKSLCFQLPALMRDGVTLVISPLIALMRDQVRALREAGVAAGALTSGNTDEETNAVWRALEGALKLLYLAPERLASAGGADAAPRRRVADRRGRGALRQPVGPRFPPRLPAHRRAAPGARRAAGRLHRHRGPRDAGRDRRAAVRRRPAPRVSCAASTGPNIHLAFQPRTSRASSSCPSPRARGRSGIVYCGTRAKTEGRWRRRCARPGTPPVTITAAWKPTRAARSRTAVPARTGWSWWPRSPSAWAWTSPTSAGSPMPTCPSRSRPIIRRSAAPAATGRRPRR